MTVAESPQRAVPAEAPEEGHFVFEQVSWEYYEETLESLERAGQHVRVTYDEGRMEIMTTTGWHEGIKTAAARLLEIYSFIRKIRIEGFGSLTCKKKAIKKGLEPDECYFIGSKLVTDKRGHMDLVHGPPPDLVLEVEITRTTIAKRPIYAALRIPELWRIDFDSITVLRLEKGEYVPVEKSRHFPDLDMKQFLRFLKMGVESQFDAVNAFAAWLQNPKPQEPK